MCTHALAIVNKIFMWLLAFMHRRVLHYVLWWKLWPFFMKF